MKIKIMTALTIILCAAAISFGCASKGKAKAPTKTSSPQMQAVAPADPNAKVPLGALPILQDKYTNLLSQYDMLAAQYNALSNQLAAAQTAANAQAQASVQAPSAPPAPQVGMPQITAPPGSITVTNTHVTFNTNGASVTQNVYVTLPPPSTKTKTNAISPGANPVARMRSSVPPAKKPAKSATITSIRVPDVPKPSITIIENTP